MKILALSTDEELNRLRQFALHYAGHSVAIINSEKEAIAAAGEGSGEYHVVLLCHKLPASAGRTIVRLLRQKASPAKLIYISHLYGEWPEVEADRYIVGADGPEALNRILEEVEAAAV
jgi:DNA-binding response OmpR family regulator